MSASPHDLHQPHGHAHRGRPGEPEGAGGYAHGGHDHGGHSHHHHHAPASFGRTFRIAIALNIGIVVLQVVFGYLSGSVALLADAGHNVSDVLGLVVAYAASVIGTRAPTERYTYGFGSSSILAALFNAVFLLVAVGALSWEAIERLAHPRPVAAGTVMAVAAIGMALNGFTAWLFAGGGRADINIRGAFLHMAADAAVSAGVIASGFLILVTGWLWLDPVVSILINAVIVWGTWGLLRHSLAMSLAAVPPGVDYADVRSFLAGRPGVARIHDLHIWALSTTQTALTAHLVVPDGDAAPTDGLVMDTTAELKRRFSIGHVTLQVERDERSCALAATHPA